MTTNDGIKSSRITLERVSTGESNKAYIEFTDKSDAGRNFQFFSTDGNPNGVVTAPEGSVCVDTTAAAGRFFVKQVSTGNDGWEPCGLMTGAAVWTPFIGGVAGGIGTANYSIQDGSVTSFTNGTVRMIVCSAVMVWTANDQAGQGVRGTLPALDGGVPRTITASILTDANFVFPAGRTYLIGTPVGAAQWDLIAEGSGVSGMSVILPVNGTLRFTMTYFTA